MASLTPFSSVFGAAAPCILLGVVLGGSICGSGASIGGGPGGGPGGWSINVPDCFGGCGGGPGAGSKGLSGVACLRALGGRVASAGSG